MGYGPIRRAVEIRIPYADNNEDGLGDAWEIQYFSSLANGADTDQDLDGHSNQKEWIAGTNPDDASSLLRLSMDLSGDSGAFIWNA